MKWNDSAECDALEVVLSEALSGGRDRMPAPCPVCTQDSVHVFFHAPQRGRLGGSWVWCSSCRCFTHGTIRAPTWWKDFEGIALTDLSALPVVLETMAVRIDEHWNRLRTDMKGNPLPPE
jgi:hypothetical protein